MPDTTFKIDEFRFVKGIAVYTGAFTPPSVPFTASDVVVITGTSGTRNYDGTSSVGDQTAPMTYDVTTAGTSGTSVFLDLSKGNFTIEGEFYIANQYLTQAGDPTPRYAIIGQYADTYWSATTSGTPQGDWWSLDFIPGTAGTDSFRFRVYSGGAYVTDVSVPVTINWGTALNNQKQNQDNAYIHFAVVRNDYAVRVFIDGDYQDVTGAITNWNTITRPIEVNGQDGRAADNLPYGMSYVANLHIVQSVLYWGDFDPGADYYYDPPGIRIIPRVGINVQVGLPGDMRGNLCIMPRLGSNSPARLFNYGMVSPGIDVTLPALQFAGTGYTQILGQLIATKPAITFTGTGIINELGVLTITLPPKTSLMEGVAGVVGTINVSLPKLVMDTTIHVNEVGTLNVTLPILLFSGTLLEGAVGSIDVSKPALQAVLTGIMSCEGTLGVTLPMFQVLIRDVPDEYLNLVINMLNKGLTKFANYNFNSMCRFAGKHLGAMSTGLYDLDHDDDDDGEFLETKVRTGYLDLEQKMKKRMDQVWLSYKSNGDLKATIILPDGNEYEYDLPGYSTGEYGGRVKFGKGIKSKYLALEIKNVEGSSLTIDAMKFHYSTSGTKKR